MTLSIIITDRIESIQIQYSTGQQTIRLMFSDLENNPFSDSYYFFHSIDEGVDDEDVQCFAEKLVFTDKVTTFTPRYHGYCYSSSYKLIVLELDPRDFLAFIQIGFADTQDGPPAVFVYTIDTASEYGFPLEVITADDSLNCTYSIYNKAFGLNDLKYYVEEGILVFHFETFINASSFNLLVLELSSTYYDHQSPNNTFIVTEGELLTQPVDGLMITAAVRLTTTDRMFLENNGICTNRTNCIIYWSQDFAISYHGYPSRINAYGTPVYRVQMVVEGKSVS